VTLLFASTADGHPTARLAAENHNISRLNDVGGPLPTIRRAPVLGGAHSVTWLNRRSSVRSGNGWRLLDSGHQWCVAAPRWPLLRFWWPPWR